MIVNKVIGVDIGGTKMHFALIREGQVIKELRISTEASGSKETVLRHLETGIRELFDQSVRGIGIGVPGLVDAQNGIVRNVLNIPAWKDVAISSYLEPIFHVPIRLENDANCFALGEKFFGKAKPYQNVICLSLGTGLGSGIIIDNKLYTGHQFMAGEFGGIKYLDYDYETYCSGKFFNWKYGHDALYYSELAVQGDKGALAIFREFGHHIGQLIQAVIYAYGPQAIILGGSLSKSFAFFRKGMDTSLSDFPHQHVLKGVHIDLSENGFVPVLGASTLTNLQP